MKAETKSRTRVYNLTVSFSLTFRSQLTVNNDEIDIQGSSFFLLIYVFLINKINQVVISSQSSMSPESG